MGVILSLFRADIVPSETGVRFLAGSLEEVGGDVGVALGRDDRGVAHKILQNPQVGAASQKMRCRAMTDTMRKDRDLQAGVRGDPPEYQPEAAPANL